MPDLIRHQALFPCCGRNIGGPRLKAGVTDEGYFAGSAGFTQGLNAPPGTADATGLSKPSLLTDETPNTQSSTRMPFKIAVHGAAGIGG